MKNFKLYAIGLMAFLMTSQSCRDEYLDTPEATTKVTEDVVFGSKEGATALIAGILRNTRAQYTATDSGNLGSIYFARTNKGNDVVNSGSWFSFDYANDNREPNFRRTSFSWNFLYFLINQTNNAILGLSNSTTIDPADRDPLLAQAYAMRAYFYFELSLEFQHTYKFDTSLPAPPIYDLPSQLEGKPMSTQQEMYAFIIDDLDKAISLGSNTRIDKSYFGKQVANAIAARVYQVMGNWTKAAQYANAAYGGNVSAALAPELYTNGFGDISNKEWLLGSPQTDDQSAYYYTAPHGFFTQTESAYNNTFINKNFVPLFTSTDVRNQFVATGRTDYRSFYTKKFVFSFSADVPLIRTPEMILIEAEALYYSNPGAAKTLLFALQRNRDPQAVISSNTGQSLLEEIYLERRKELYGEIGVEWYDAKRLQRGLPRDQGGAHRLPLTSNPMLPNDKRFFLKIPQSELDANPNIPASINSGR